MGIAGFYHDFETLQGKSSVVIDAFEAVGKNPPAKLYSMIYLLLFPMMPILLKIPNKRKAVLDRYRKTMGSIGEALLSRVRSDKEEAGGVKHPASTSIIGTLRMFRSL